MAFGGSRKGEEEEGGEWERLKFVDFFSCLSQAKPKCSPGQDCLYAHTNTCICACVCACASVTMSCHRWGDGLWSLLRDGILMLLCL